jgi:aminopeptidase-like protein
MNPPSVAAVKASADFAALGQQMHALVAELYPVCRSITGEGLRATLRRVARDTGLSIREVPTGTQVLDWTVPREWNIRDAWVANARGERVIDFRKSNLHVVNYSVPVHARMTLADLRPKLHALPDRPGWIPYRTSYYAEDWGFCLAHNELASLPEGTYEVAIDSSLEPGSLTYGEIFLPGSSADEVLLSAHCCHPSLANDNLSGVALLTTLARLLSPVARRYSYRLLFVPGTIGSIAWLAANEDAALRVRHGLTVACVGDVGSLTYKKSRRGDAEVDRAAQHVLKASGQPHRVVDFSPYGYDERQYNSPGFNLPVGSLTRTPHGQYREYHTSADDVGFVKPESLAGSLSAYLSVLAVLEGNGRYRNTHPKGEPQLGKRGLYRAIGGEPDPGQLEMAMLWVLNQSDGGPTLLDIAERAGLPFERVRAAADTLLAHGLLEAVRDPKEIASSGPS